MLKNCTTTLLTVILIFLLASCEESSNEEQKQTKEKNSAETSEPAVQKKQEIKSELSTEEAIILNDQIMIQIESFEDQLNQLQELDLADADSTLMYQKADSLITQIRNFGLTGFEEKLPTLNSSNFLRVVFELITVMDSKATIYKDYAGENSIPDLEWEEAWINELNQIIEPVFFQFIEARASLTKAQEEFISLHGATLSEV